MSESIGFNMNVRIGIDIREMMGITMSERIGINTMRGQAMT